jgi:hypothetical protein
MDKYSWVTALKVQAKHIVKYSACLDKLPPRVPDPYLVEKTPEQKALAAAVNVKKRLRDAVSNLTEIFRASEMEHEQMLYYSTDSKVHRRRPVFLTLTVPEQNVSDQEIKQIALHNFLRSITRYKDCKCYIWKAEAQERGAIHFHLIIDCFIYEKEVRKIWYKNLYNLGCIPSTLHLDKASKLTYFQLIEDIDFIAERIGSYLESERDENGQLIHKHDDTKRVRDINGHRWGCSDNLRYKQLTVISPNENVMNCVDNQSLWKKEITNAEGKTLAFLYVYQQAFKNPVTNKWEKNKAENPIGALHTCWHLYHAENIYNGGKDVIPLFKEILKYQQLGASWLASQLNLSLEEWHQN